MCRVRFATGPLQNQYETPDGHPNHEGETARQRRALQVQHCLLLLLCAQRSNSDVFDQPHKRRIMTCLLGLWAAGASPGVFCLGEKEGLQA